MTEAAPGRHVADEPACRVSVLYHVEPFMDLAAHAGVSQPAVSQYLSSLRAHGDVSFEAPGWLADRAQLPESYWQGYSPRSGDVAADAVLPWKMPAVAIVYAAVDNELMDALGFVRSDSAAAATILVRPVPDDSFNRDAIVVREMNVAPHLHLVADLIGLGGDDRLEAASPEVLEWARARSVRAATA